MTRVLTPNDFTKKWGGDEPLSLASIRQLERVELTVESREFLLRAGLPRSAAPFLDFDLESTRAFSPVHETWTCLGEEYGQYRLIGNTGWGDPVCVDEAVPSRVVYLNHDDEFKMVFVNSSIPQLADCLLTFREFVRRVQEEGGEDAFLEERFPDKAWEWVCQEFEMIDNPALDEGAFWANELRIYK